MVRQNKILQRDIDNYIDQVKKLMERISVLENNNNNDSNEDNKAETDETDHIKEKKPGAGMKGRNKITINVSDAQHYTNNNNNISDDMKKRKHKKVTKIDLKHLDEDPADDFLEDFEAIKKLTGDRQQGNALSRCKSFLGIKNRNNFYENEFSEERSRSAEDNFILKTESSMGVLKARDKVKRSKSMDIFRRSGLFQQGKKDFPVVTKSYSHYCKNKIDYVKKWQKDSMQYDLKSQQHQAFKNKYISPKNKSFYSLYF